MPMNSKQDRELDIKALGFLHWITYSLPPSYVPRNLAEQTKQSIESPTQRNKKKNKILFLSAKFLPEKKGEDKRR